MLKIRAIRGERSLQERVCKPPGKISTLGLYIMYMLYYIHAISDCEL